MMSTLWIRILALSSIAQLCFLCPTPSVRSAGADPPAGSTWVKVWEDEFTGTTLDTNKWGHFNPGYPRTDRIAVQATDAVSVSGGNLVIRTYSGGYPDPNDPDPPPVTLTHYTGMIETGGDLSGDPPGCPNNPNQLVPPGNKYMPRYGYIEASIDFDGQSGMWHSFFVTYPNGLLQGPMLPQVRGTEMDIVEHKKMAGATDVSNVAESALHWLTQNSPVCPNPTVPGGPLGSGPVGSGLATGFHTYGVEWTPNYVKYYYDGAVVWTVNDSPTSPVSRTNEYILLCGEVPPDNFSAYGTIPTGGFGVLGSSSNPKMTVAWVRHYQLLAAPTNLVAMPQSTSQINLVWADNTYVEDDFKVERSTNNGSGWTAFSQIATVGADVHTYLDTGLNANTLYSYRVRTRIGTNYSTYSNTAYPDVYAPAAVSNLLPSIGKKSVALSWLAPGDDGTGQTVVQYDLRRSTSLITAANFGSATQITTSAPHVSGYPECVVVNNLVCGTPYFFAIKSKDEYGNWSAISNVPTANTPCTGAGASCGPPPTDTTAPAAVTNLSVPSVGQTTLAVSWTAPGDDGATGTASEYDFRYSAGPINAANFGSATRVLIVAPALAGSPECRLVSGLSPSTTYYFALKTRDDAGNWSGISNVVIGATVTQNWFAECPGGGAAKRPIIASDESPRLFTPGANPARGTTSFRISVPRESQGATLRVGVFDVQGRRVRTLVNRIATPGSVPIEWNLLDDSGRRVASGLYMVRVDVGDVRKTFRLTVVR